ncbi:dihydroorotase [Pararhodonellum marinum]|uniref:dihydroorotase n=1 Tax=Pararhodonellum marinum TaxID=2755358 RepID=UPI00188E4043|nr:dihydroorotase [Pararhodonellum marinum]
MTVLFKSLRVIDPHGIQDAADYFFNGSDIKPVMDSENKEADLTIEAGDFLASQGWIDLRCLAGEPGLESKETLESLGESLKVSGFSQAVLLPNTQPVVQSKNEAEFIKNKTKDFFTTIHLQAAVTKDTLGEDLTEILDLHHNGVKLFGDGLVPLSNSDRLMKILQYLQKFNGLLFDQAYDPLLALFGQMHEGPVSTQLGMKGIPSLAEEVAIQKNIEILKYTGGRIHFQTISTAKAVDYIRLAKKEGLRVTADVSLYQLLFLDEDLKAFDANLKVNPPFRTSSERAALIEGLKDGTIDAIVSNHQPVDFDQKHMEFDLAAFGMAGLQTFLPGLVKLSEELGWPLLIQKLTEGPSKVLSVSNAKSFTVFDPKEAWTYHLKSNRSLSSNSPWFGKTLTGKVKYVINQGKFEQIDG